MHVSDSIPTFSDEIEQDTQVLPVVEEILGFLVLKHSNELNVLGLRIDLSNTSKMVNNSRFSAVYSRISDISSRGR